MGDHIDVEQVDTSSWPDEAGTNLAQSIVQQRFELSEDYARDQLDSMTAFAQALEDALTGFVMPSTDIDYSFVPASLRDAMAEMAGYRPDRPTDEELALVELEAPAEPDFAEIEDPSITAIPEFNVEAHEIIYDAAPESSMPTDPGDAPALAIPDRVDPPTYVIPAEPSLEDISIPADPEILSVPSFSGVMPTLELVPPGNLYTYSENPFDATLAAAIKTKILADLDEGGTGLGETVEDAIWERMQDRRRDEHEANYNQTMDTQNLGFDLPPGALVSRLDELNAAHLRALAQDSHEIAIKQSEIARDHLHFTIEKGIALQGVLDDTANKVAQRAFESARYLHESSVTAFEARVNAYNAQLAGYQAEATVYKTILEGTLVYLQQYNARLEGRKLAVEIQGQKVSLYLARLEAIKGIVAVYSERVKAQATEMEAERLKLQAFGMTVDVYGKKIEARTAEYNLWQTKITAEGLKVDNYAKQVEAYATRVRAIATEAEVEKAKILARSEKNRSLAETYRANIDAYRARIQEAIERVKAQVEAYGADVDLYKADASVMGNQLDADVKLIAAQMDQSKNQTDILLKQAEMIIQSALQEYGINADALKAKLNTAAQIAASALSALHAQASLGMSYSGANSFSWSRSESVANAASLSEAHSYQEA